eukprot:3104817-Karenia_brevis.AAC.1
MLNYGLVNRLPHTSLFVDLPEHVLHLLDNTVLHSLHHISAKQQHQYDEGQLHLATKKVTGHFTPKSTTQVRAMTAALVT